MNHLQLQMSVTLSVFVLSRLLGWDAGFWIGVGCALFDILVIASRF